MGNPHLFLMARSIYFQMGELIAMPILLKNFTPSGESLEATYLPEKGMNMISFKKAGFEVIDQSTQAIFDERFAGLGALIGPHFHRRNPQILPKLSEAQEQLFPHIARVKSKGVQDPFSHGIGRYAPWQAKATENQIHAQLTGKDLWNGIPLATLEGQQFTMKFDVILAPDGLHLDLSVVSDMDSVVGIHYYFLLPQSKGIVTSDVQPFYLDQNEKKALPKEWNFSSQHTLKYDLTTSTDYTFYPFPDPLKGKIHLDAENYQLNVKYTCQSQENCWQLYHPQGASFVCIEPLSAQNPRRPNLTASAIKIHLQIL
jgi:hypothetical protein